MKNFFTTTSIATVRFWQHIQKTWRTFLFMPSRYWKIALIVFASIFTIILLTDAWIFWRFAYAPQQISDETGSAQITLKRPQLELAVQALRAREAKFLQKDDGQVLRDIFRVPETTVSTP